MALRGGRRDRMILESVVLAIEDDLTSREWFDPGRQHQPIVIIDEYPDTEDRVVYNTMSIQFGDSNTRLAELGSRAEIHMVPIFVDFFAENDALKRDVIGDIYAWANETTAIPIIDLSLGAATPTIEFYLEIEAESAQKEYPPRATNPWMKHWGIVSFMVSDMRANT